MPTERTLVIIKPDAVRRGLVGEIIARFERKGLKIVGLRMVRAGKEDVEKFYPSSEDWFRSAGTKMLRCFAEIGRSPKEVYGTDDPVELGKAIKKLLVEYMTSGPIVLVVLEGNRAVEVVRRLVGPTMPYEAPPGTIRGDFGCDSADLAAVEGRVVYNLVHASDSVEEAQREISFWFNEEELLG